MAFCTACGSPVNAGERSCPACGAPAGGAADAAGQQPDDEAFGGLFAPRPAERGDTARLPQQPDQQPDQQPEMAPGGGTGPGWAGPGWAGYGGEGGPGTGWMARPPRPPGGRKKLLIGVIVLVVLVALGGGVLGFAMHRHRGAASGGAGQGGSASPSGAASPTGSAASGATTVAVSPAAARDPRARPIASLLANYFTAINSHDFTAYQALLDPVMKRSVTVSQFASGYRSTADSGATLTAISTAPDGRTTANVRFTSHQDPADSPDRSACTTWTITLFLEPSHGGGYVIGPARRGYHAKHRSC